MQCSATAAPAAGGGVTPTPRPGLEPGRIRVETEADLAAALVYERGEPVGEGRAGGDQGRSQPPLTRCLRPAPAENFGTLPPAIVIRSPVRGLTP